MELSWIQKYKLHYAKLTSKEKQVVQYILAHPDQIGKITLRNCADSAGVGQSTVLRCITSCGFKSWKTFQRCVWQESQQVFSSEPMWTSEKQSIHTIPEQIALQSIHMLTELLYQIDLKDFDIAIQLLKRAKTIDIYGVERSAAMASDLTGKLLYLGLPCRNYTDLYYQKISAEHLGTHDVAIAISQSGETNVVIKAMHASKKRGAKTIVITGNSNSTLCQYADLIFITPSIEFGEKTKWVSSRITQTAFIEMLYFALLQSDQKRFYENLSRSSNEFEKI